MSGPVKDISRRVDQDRLVQMWMDAQPVPRIAAALGCSDFTVRSAADRLALPSRNARCRVVVEADELPHFAPIMFVHQVPIACVARVFGVTMPEARAQFARFTGQAARPAPRAASDGAPEWSMARDVALQRIVPGPGAYAALSILAMEWGTTMQRVQARWHRVRRAA